MADSGPLRAHATATSPPSVETGDQHVVATFCFVDIAGYSALTESHGESAAADLVDGFTRLIRSAVGALGTVQELTGDNAFLVFPNPEAALRSIADLYRQVADLRDFPMLRTGLHHGDALRRRDRYFGSTVNVAARTTAQARAGEILCTASVVQGIDASSAVQFEVHHVGMVKLRNLPDQVDLYRIVLPDTNQRSVIDPVCQMQVDPRSGVADGWHDGRQYWFCSAACARRFAKAPSDFV
jgi:class 3 adenylate cyclase